MMTATNLELAGSRRAPPQDAVRVRDVDPHARIEVTVTLKGPDLPALDQDARTGVERPAICFWL